MSSVHEELRGRVTTALTEVTLAEGVLEATLRALGSGGPRAEKVTVTNDVSEAFARLRRAHTELSKLRELLGKDE